MGQVVLLGSGLRPPALSGLKRPGASSYLHCAFGSACSSRGRPCRAILYRQGVFALALGILGGSFAVVRASSQRRVVCPVFTLALWVPRALLQRRLCRLASPCRVAVAFHTCAHVRPRHQRLGTSSGGSPWPDAGSSLGQGWCSAHSRQHPPSVN